MTIMKCNDSWKTVSFEIFLFKLLMFISVEMNNGEMIIRKVGYI